jgi:hypothetical protein
LLFRSAALLALFFPVHSQASGEPHIRLEPLTSDRWRVTWQLERPAARLRFARAANFFREKQWQVITPGYALEREAESQLLVLQSGATPQQQIVAEFDVYTEPMIKEYQAFVRFTDGGLLVYTGHLYLHDVADESAYASPDQTPNLTTLDVQLPAGAQAVVRGRVHANAFRWDTGAEGDGTFIYFGASEPLETDHLLAVVDSGIPAWLRQRALDLLPRLFDDYRRRFGLQLPWKPLVFLAYDASDRPGYSMVGGALAGLLQMQISGPAWAKKSAEAGQRFDYLLAHEAAHFWNGQLAEYRDIEESWMHEGSADAMAWTALHELGQVEGEELRRQRSEAINQCFFGLGDRPLRGAAARGHFHQFYTCGHLLALWTGAALARSGAPVDLFGFWHALVERARQDPGGRYDQSDYFDLLREFGVDSRSRRAMRALVEATGPAKFAAARAGMLHAGLRLSTVPGPPDPAWTHRLARALVEHLLSQACGRYSFNGSETRFVSRPIENCPLLNRELVIEQVAETPLDDIEVAWRRVNRACRAGRTVRLGTASDSVAVACQAPPPARPPRFSLHGAATVGPDATGSLPARQPGAISASQNCRDFRDPVAVLECVSSLRGHPPASTLVGFSTPGGFFQSWRDTASGRTSGFAKAPRMSGVASFLPS